MTGTLKTAQGLLLDLLVNYRFSILLEEWDLIRKESHILPAGFCRFCFKLGQNCFSTASAHKGIHEAEVSTVFITLRAVPF